MNSKLKDTLLGELSKDKPNEDLIRSLMKEGANINVMDVITDVDNGLDIKYIQLIIDLGANLNYEDEGFNCLADACMIRNYELVELLLKAGANPNCISTESAESLLDYIEFEEWFEENENGESNLELKRIIQLLKDYGAKNISELYSDNVEDYLTIFATYEPTGIITKGGYIKIQSIPNIDQEFIKHFNEWVASNPDKWNEYEYSRNEGKILNPPDISSVKQHNQKGLEYAKQIKTLVNEGVEVKFLFVNPNDLEKYNSRNVEHLVL